MRRDFSWLPTNLEAYCWLRKHLPAGYTVSAEPSASYFSEWGYRYRVHHGDDFVREWQGDFRTLDPDALSDEVVDFIRQLGASDAHR